MNEKRMSDKQYNCIEWICGVLDIEYDGTTSSYDAWKFIKDNKPKADKIQAQRNSQMNELHDNEVESLIHKNPELAADLFVAKAMAAVHYPKYQVSYDARNRTFHDEFDGINLDDEDIDTLCPGGIHCADDINEYGWMFALRDNPWL